MHCLMTLQDRFSGETSIHAAKGVHRSTRTYDYSMGSYSLWLQTKQPRYLLTVKCINYDIKTQWNTTDLGK